MHGVFRSYELTQLRRYKDGTLALDWPARRFGDGYKRMKGLSDRIWRMANLPKPIADFFRLKNAEDDEGLAQLFTEEPR